MLGWNNIIYSKMSSNIRWDGCLGWVLMMWLCCDDGCCYRLVIEISIHTLFIRLFLHAHATHTHTHTERRKRSCSLLDAVDQTIRKYAHVSTSSSSSFLLLLSFSLVEYFLLLLVLLRIFSNKFTFLTIFLVVQILHV